MFEVLSRSLFSRSPDGWSQPAHWLQEDSAASCMHSWNTKMCQVQSSSTFIPDLLSRQPKNSLKLWFMFLLTSRQCSCPFLFCVQHFSDWQTGWGWEPEPRWDPGRPPSPGHRRLACRRHTRSSPQTIWEHQREKETPWCVRQGLGVNWCVLSLEGFLKDTGAGIYCYRSVSYRRTLIICSQGPSTEAAAHRSTTSCSASVLVFLTK